MQLLVTGTAGFIGNAVALRLLERGHTVHGLDVVNDYYDVRLKEARLRRLTAHAGFTEHRVALQDREAMAAVFARVQPERVVHLAAQAGVRYSLQNPHAYVDSNLVGFCNLLEGCRHHGVQHLVFASSSSVYGANTTVPFSPHHGTQHPVSLYAATKKANEMMAHAYSHLYGLPVTGLRFFTVYGPWGRPDMAPFLFLDALMHDRPIRLFNHGRMARDFTYIDDVADGVVRALGRVPAPDPAWDAAHPDPATSAAAYRLYNMGNSEPVALETFVRTLEAAAGHSARIEYAPMQPGDVVRTSADMDDTARDLDFRPYTPLARGLERFVAWYRDYHGL